MECYGREIKVLVKLEKLKEVKWFVYKIYTKKN